jgi:hypothetical protein
VIPLPRTGPIVCGRIAALGVAAVVFSPLLPARHGTAESQDSGAPRTPRIAAQNGEFLEEGTGRAFVPLGFNFVRLRPREPGMIAHATFDDAYYDAATVEGLFEDLAAHGFNTVRVFIDPTSPGVGLFESRDALRLSPAYMANVFDFLGRAREHGVYVIPAFSMWGPNSTWLSRGKDSKPMVTGANKLYLIESAADTRAAMLSEFVKAIKSHDPGLLPVVFAYELQNELCYFVGEEPLSLTEGQFPFLGKTYDLSSEEELQRLVDDVSAYWVNKGVAGVRSTDPEAMVSISLFTYAAVGRSGPNALRSDETRDGRVPARPLALIDSDASYLDLHMYPGSDMRAHAKAHLEGVEFAALKERADTLGKPIIVGEFGAFNADWAFPDRAVVPQKMREYTALLRGLGFSGALYWTYDSPTAASGRKHIWDAKDGDGSIFRALAGAWSDDGPDAEDTRP